MALAWRRPCRISSFMIAFARQPSRSALRLACRRSARGELFSVLSRPWNAGSAWAGPLATIFETEGIQRRQAERLFLASMGMTPGRFYRELRIRHAVELMRQTRMTVHEAALAVGFSSQPVFSRACGQHFGMSPRAPFSPVPHCQLRIERAARCGRNDGCLHGDCDPKGACRPSNGSHRLALCATSRCSFACAQPKRRVWRATPPEGLCQSNCADWRPRR